MIRHKVQLKKLFFISILIIIIGYLLSSFYFVFKPDEEVSMGLIQKNIYHIISIDSLDVHPPLYYIILRIFLEITTFWTKSIFVKTIFARIFSLIFLCLSMYYMIKIFNMCKIMLNNKLQIMFILIAPGVINESAKIRMYSLSAFLIVFELYQLMKFERDNKFVHIIFITLMAILAEYTFYPLAISAGLFILIYFIYFIYHSDFNKSLKLFISGIVMLIMYLPWIKVILKQFNIHAGKDSSLVYNYFYTITSSITQINAPSPVSPLLKYTCLISLPIILLFVLLIYISNKNIINESRFNKALLITLINFVLTLIITVFVCKRQFRLTIIYPIYFILISFLIVIAVKCINIKEINKFIKLFIIFVLMIFMTYSFAAFANNIKGYDIPSYQLVNDFNKWKHSNRKYVSINKPIGIANVNDKITGNRTYADQNSIYLSSINKRALINTTKNNEKAIKNFIYGGKGYIKFSKELFTNIKYKN